MHAKKQIESSIYETLKYDWFETNDNLKLVIVN